MTVLPLDSGPKPPVPVSSREVHGSLLSKPSAESPQLGDYLRIVCSHWRTVACIAIGGALCGVLSTYLVKPSFRALSVLEIQNLNGDFLNMKQLTPTSDNSQGTDALTDLQTQIEILQSKSLSKETARVLSRDNSKGAGVALSESVLGKVVDSLKVRGVGQTRIIRVQADAPSPGLASKFVNTLVAEYMRQNTKARWLMAEVAEESTRGQIGDMRQKLRTSEQELETYAREHGLIFTSERQKISDDRLKQVQEDLLRARADLADKQARRQVASVGTADSLPDVVRDADLRDLRSKLIDLRRREAEMLTVFKPDYSEAKKLRAQIKQLQVAADQERDRIVSRIKNEYIESSGREKLLSSAYDAAVRGAATDSQTGVQYDILRREVDANLSAYQEMLVKVKELSVATAIRTSNVRVIDMATSPQRPYSPKLPLNVGLGLFSGLALGIGFVLVRERGNPNLRHPGEVTLRLGVPELGVISSYHQNVDVPAKHGVARLKSGHDDFRTVLTSIMFSEERENQPRVVVITSSSPQEGKTTVASNLATALADAGKHVLLIDGDLRKPQIHELFGVPNALGLGNLLQDNISRAETQKAIQSSRVPGLSILTAGSFSASPANLLFESRLRELIDAFRKRFDMVIVDSSPLMRMPDARLIARSADGVVLVARANRTARTSIAMACQRLTLDRSRVLGVVLNDWDGSDSPYPAYPN